MLMQRDCAMFYSCDSQMVRFNLPLSWKLLLPVVIPPFFQLPVAVYKYKGWLAQLFRREPLPNISEYIFINFNINISMF